MPFKKRSEDTLTRTRRSAFVTLIISYICILLVPLVFSLVMLFNTQKRMDTNLFQINETALRQAINLVDNTLDNATVQSAWLTTRDSFQKILYYSQPFTVDERYAILEARRTDLGICKNLNGISTMMVYYTRGDYVLMPNAQYSIALCADEVFKDSGITTEELAVLMNSSHLNEVLVLDDMLLHMQSFPLIGVSPSANIFSVIKKDTLMESMRKIDWIRDGYLFVYDENDTLIMGNAADAAQITLASNGTADTPNGKTLYSQQIDGNGWRYVLVTSPIEYARNRSGLSNVYLPYGVGTILIGFWMIYAFARKNYTPIQKLLTRVQGDTKTKNMNEFSAIDNAVQQMMLANDTMRAQMASHSKWRQRNYLSRLLARRLQPQSFSEAKLQEHNLLFPHPEFRVVLFRIEDYDRYFADFNGKEEEQPIDAMYDGLMFLLQEMVNQHFVGYVCDLNGWVIAVLNYDGKTTDAALEKIIRDILVFVRDGMYIRMNAFVSAVHRSVLNLPQAYEEACMIDNREPSNTEMQVYWYSPQSLQVGYAYSAEMEQNLTGSLVAGDTQAALDTLKDIFNACMSEETMPMKLFRCFANDIAVTLMRAIETTGTVHEDLAAGVIAERIAKMTSMDKIRDYLNETVRTICNAVDLSKESHNDQLLDVIMAYLRQNYRDVNLSNTIIAEAAGISPAYLSRFFKQQTGLGVAAYLNRIRVDEAKKLLRNHPEMTISRICENIGFDNVATFIRVFKKVEGVTPGKFR